MPCRAGGCTGPVGSEGQPARQGSTCPILLGGAELDGAGLQIPRSFNSTTKQPDPWLEACVYACARLLSMPMHAYARLHPNTLHACVRLGSGTQRWTSCIVMHRLSCARLTLVCAHPSNHRSGLEVHPHPFTHSLTHDQTSRTRGTALEHP